MTFSRRGTWTSTEATDTVHEIRRAIHELVGPLRSTVSMSDGAGDSRLIVSERPGLLDQLALMIDHPAAGTGGRGSIPGSRPPIVLAGEAMLDRIQREARVWTRRMGASSIEALGDTAAELDDHEVEQLLGAVTRWRVLALCTTPWEGSHLRPAVPCPEVWCEAHSAIVMVADELDSATARQQLWVAACTACGATWAEDRWMELRAWVDWCIEHLSGPEHMVSTDAGVPTPCPDPACAHEREAMRERRAERLAAARELVAA